MKKMNYYCFVFLISTIAGWFGELIWRSIYFHRLVNPGALIGPFCPIYGTAVLLICLTLKKENNFFINFLKIGVVCTIVEYLTAFISEEIFHNRLWNYSKHPFNFQGRICLDMTIVFIVCALGFFYLIKPILDKFINENEKTVKIFNIIVGFLFLCNIILQIIF